MPITKKEACQRAIERADKEVPAAKLLQEANRVHGEVARIIFEKWCKAFNKERERLLREAP